METEPGGGRGTEHPIQGLMQTAMQSLQGMVDVNTVVGDAVETKDGAVIVPVSQVSFGFAAGGGEYGTARREPAATPFGGGSGAGVSVRPVAFLVVQQGKVRLLPVDQRASFERLIEMAPELADKIIAAATGRSPRGNNGVHLDGAEPVPGVAAPAEAGAPR